MNSSESSRFRQQIRRRVDLRRQARELLSVSISKIEGQYYFYLDYYVFLVHQFFASAHMKMPELSSIDDFIGISSQYLTRA